MTDARCSRPNVMYPRVCGCVRKRSSPRPLAMPAHLADYSPGLARFFSDWQYRCALMRAEKILTPFQVPSTPPTQLTMASGVQ